MTENFDRIRTALLDALVENRKVPSTGNVLALAQSKLEGVREEEIVLVWGECFRTGVVGWGLTVKQPGPDWIHVGQFGKRILANRSRDPMNGEGYLASVRGLLAEHPVAESYIEEAVRAFQSGCPKAVAVLVGGASEALVLDLRDHLRAALESAGETVPSRLKSRKLKTVRDAIKIELSRREATMDRPLKEAVSAYWSSLTEQIRVVRNDAGHPKSVAPVTEENVHGALLQFPELARLVALIGDWIDSTIK